MIVGTYPIALGTDAPIIKIFNAEAGGTELNDTLDSGTYILYGTLPRGFYNYIDIWVEEVLGFNVYNAQLVGIASANQMGSAEVTYQKLSGQVGGSIGSDTWTDLPLDIGTLTKGSRIKVRLRYDVEDTATLGIKVFGSRVEGDKV